MTLENGDKATLARIDERTLNLSMQVGLLSQKIEALPGMFVTRDQCALNQRVHERSGILDRAESIGKVGAIVAIGVSVVWAVLKHV